MRLYIDGQIADPESLPYIKEWVSGEDVEFSTSGTTGHPKKVRHSREVLDQVVQNNIKHFGHSSKSRLFSILNPKGIGYLSLMLGVALETGCDLYMESFSFNTYVSRLNQCKPTFTILPPNIWRVMHRRRLWQDLDLSYCENFVMGGDFTPNGALDEIRSHGASRVLNVYGSTEVPPCVLSSEEENTYSITSAPADVRIRVSDRGTLMCKWTSQDEWWDSEDIVSGGVRRLEMRGRERNMFKQDICRVYPEDVERIALDHGAEMALCRQSGNYADLYCVGNIDREAVKGYLSFIPRLRLFSVKEIKVDDNLRKIVRNQEVEIINEY